MTGHCCVFEFLQRSVDEIHLSVFRVKTPFSNSSSVVWTEPETQFFVVMSDCWFACLLNRILLFWNQTLTCVSVRWSAAASLRRSSPATYCCLANVLSKRSSCAGVKMVRDLLLDFLPFFLLSSRLMFGSIVTGISRFSFNYVLTVLS